MSLKNSFQTERLNFFHQMTRNKDVADVYDLFNDNSLLTIENDQVKYNTKGLDTILIKLESLNRNFDREKAHSAVPRPN